MEAFIHKLMSAYSAETCHPSYLEQWSPENPTAGQCAITALLVYETFGFDIYEIKVGRARHFFNKTSDGDIIDLTAAQFSHPVDYTNCRERNFKELYKSCATRYNILKNNFYGGALCR